MPPTIGSIKQSNAYIHHYKVLIYMYTHIHTHTNTNTNTNTQTHTHKHVKVDLVRYASATAGELLIWCLAALDFA